MTVRQITAVLPGRAGGVGAARAERRQAAAHRHHDGQLRHRR
jgi:hypothetical protein